MKKINIIGAGLAGCEAAYQAAKRGVGVKLYEMKPIKFSPAHHSENYAELVCSNSLKAMQLTNASGLIKAELEAGDSLIMKAARASAVGAGGALAVDREKFSSYITNEIRSNPNIETVSQECLSVPKDEITVIATGPLTSDGMAEYIAKLTGESHLHFFDAAAPIVDANTIDRNIVFAQSRYDKGEADYLNCPMNKEQYDHFYNELMNAERAELHDFDHSSPAVFEGCMPVEIMASRGYDTIRFGPLKPVGLCDPRTGAEPYAVVQLRKENDAGSMYNLVGFQTNLTFPEQKRVFRLIPGLENAAFLRYGVMHRNTFINSPKLLNADYSLRNNGNIFFAGQLTGVEGYLESTDSGMVAGINAARRALEKESIIFPQCSITGALASYISNSNNVNFQPMNANFGILEPLNRKVKGGKSAAHQAMSERAAEAVKGIFENEDNN